VFAAGGGFGAGKPPRVGGGGDGGAGERPVLVAGEGGGVGKPLAVGDGGVGGGTHWDISQVLRILRAHDWKVAIVIAVSLWDSATAMKQLQRLDDAITEATEIGLLEGWTVHCDECDVMRWINEDTHLPEPWFCPNCLATKDASLYGTRLKPSALAKTFLFKVVKSKVTHEIAEIIISMMSTCDSERRMSALAEEEDFDEEIKEHKDEEEVSEK
jgi:hypothetical protein